MKKFKKIYFVGIKGVGMASLALIAKEAGFLVSGSDIGEEFITDKILQSEGIVPLLGFERYNIDRFFKDIPKEQALVVTTAAHLGFDNPETKYALSLNIKVLTHGQAVGEFMNGGIFGRSDIQGISVCGAHGKTTISSLLATCLTKLGFDPTYTVGTSEIFPLGNAGHFGKGKYFIAEADEYVSDINYDRKSKLLYQFPHYAIINNIDFDHPDFYKNITEIESTFLQFTNNIKEDGVLFINIDDTRAVNIKNKLPSTRKVVTYGTDFNADYYITKYYQNGYSSLFNVESKSINLGSFKISLPGYHNVKNTLSVIALLTELGISTLKIKEVLPIFMGTKRRIEILGKTKDGLIIIDDYAHHPAEIKASLATLRKVYPDKRIISIFQPHTYSRTSSLFNEFLSAFLDCDNLILLPVYASLREKENKDVVSEKLFSEFQKLRSSVTLLKERKSVVEYIKQNYRGEDYVVVTMGAGNVYKIAEDLIK